MNHRESVEETDTAGQGALRRGPSERKKRRLESQGCVSDTLQGRLRASIGERWGLGRESEDFASRNG